MLKIKKQIYNAVLISADSDEELADSLMRFQEHYESPEWADKIFTIGQFKQWYSATYGADTYRLDWRGFNFPSYVLKAFRDGLFDPLTEGELSILNLLKYRNDSFYIIGSNEDSVLHHELCHALYHFDLNYKTSIDQVITENKNQLTKAFKYLLKLGYHKKVLYDELQAYVLDKNWFKEHNIEIPEIVSMKIKQLHRKYSLQ
jgi:hypothetical protein